MSRAAEDMKRGGGEYKSTRGCFSAGRCGGGRGVGHAAEHTPSATPQHITSHHSTTQHSDDTRAHHTGHLRDDAHHLADGVQRGAGPGAGARGRRRRRRRQQPVGVVGGAVATVDHHASRRREERRQHAPGHGACRRRQGRVALPLHPAGGGEETAAAGRASRGAVHCPGPHPHHAGPGDLPPPLLQRHGQEGAPGHSVWRGRAVAVLVPAARRRDAGRPHDPWGLRGQVDARPAGRRPGRGDGGGAALRRGHGRPGGGGRHDVDAAHAGTDPQRVLHGGDGVERAVRLRGAV